MWTDGDGNRTEIRDVFRQLTAVGIWEVLHRLLARCSQDVGVDGG